MRVLVADSFEASGLADLRAAGCEVTHSPQAKDAELVRQVAELRPDVLIVRSTKVPEEVLAAGPVKLVVRAGAGYNTIDVAAASRRGIYVANCPGRNSVAVAELAFGLIAALDRRIADNVADLRAGIWNKAEYGKARGLAGRTLGLIGLGGIGSAMVPRAQAFELDVLAWSRSLTAERADELGVRRADSVLEVAAGSDIVSVHLALTADTRGLLGREFFSAMRDGAYFVNTSRGEVVDEAALAAAVELKGLRAGLDVFAGEPGGGSGSFHPAVVDLPGVYGTHHIGASTEQAQLAIAAEAVRIVRAFAGTGAVPNVVNLAAATPAEAAVIVRHLDRPGVLAAVLDAIGGAGLNVQEMDNVVFAGGEAAVARINVEGPLPGEVLAAIGELELVLDVQVVAL